MRGQQPYREWLRQERFFPYEAPVYGPLEQELASQFECSRQVASWIRGEERVSDQNLARY